jgi:hypothetical protein
LASQNVLSVRYQFFDINNPESGVGQFNLATQALKNHIDEHTLQISDTQVFSAKMLNQLRFQYLHDVSTSVPQTMAPTISVESEFIGGGSSSGTSSGIQNHYEVQNLTSFFLGKHTLVVGGRLRDEQESNTATSNFLGTYTFPSLTAYATAQACAANGGTNCSGATLFSINQGIPLISVNLLDVGLFAQDDWKLRSNMTLSLGLRWESQTGISDHSDFAPRVGFAWGLNGSKNKAAKTVLRTGFGIFYDRFPENLLLDSERYNGTTQQEFLIESPACFPTPSNCNLSTASTAALTKYQIDPHLRAPYTMQSAIGLEQQVSKSTTVSVTYLNSHGTHQLITNDINAPPLTFVSGVPQLGARPFGNAAGNIYDFQSVGLFNQSQLIANFNLRLSNKVSLGGFYTLSYADADTNGNSAALAMDPYDINLDYGRAPFDVRNRVVIIGNWNLPHRISVSPFLVTSTGSPFSVTLGQDLFGTGALNARPALGTPCAVTPVTCPLGTTFSTPTTTQSIIAPYQYDNPGQFTFNLRLAKTWGFGKETQRQTNVGGFGGPGGPGGGGRGGGGGGRGGGRGLGGGGLSGAGGGGMFGGGATTSNRRFNLTASINARNVFNDVNLGGRIGTVGSTHFDQSTSLGGLFGGGPGGGGPGGGGGLTAANRRIDFQVTFVF